MTEYYYIKKNNLTFKSPNYPSDQKKILKIIPVEDLFLEFQKMIGRFLYFWLISAVSTVGI